MFTINQDNDIFDLQPILCQQFSGFQDTATTSDKVIDDQSSIASK